MSLISRFGVLVTAVAIAMAASAASAAPMFRPSVAPMFREGRAHHARVIPPRPPSTYGYGYRGPNGPICYTKYEPPGPCEV
jgi:hypothetical protein